MEKIQSAMASWQHSGEMRPVLSSEFEVFCKQVGNENAPSKKTALLLHGFPESSYSYHKVIDGLLSHFDRIICFDFLGFGSSNKPLDYDYQLNTQAQIALDVWQSYGVKGGHLIAHDMGDSVATELVAMDNEGKIGDWFSDGFQSITFTNGGMVIELSALRVLQKLMLNPIFGPFLSRISQFRTFKQQVFSANGNDHLDEAEVEIMWTAFRSGNGKKIGHQLIQYINERLRYQNNRWLPALQETTIPIHICWGALDKVAPISIAEKLYADICPSATLTTMPKTGHFCQLDNPDEWLKSIILYYQKG